MLNIRCIYKKNSKVLNLNLFLITLLFLVPLLNSGCDGYTTTENFEETTRENFDGQISILSYNIPSSADIDEIIIVETEVKFLTSGRYYVEAGLRKSSETFLQSISGVSREISACDSSIHYDGKFVDVKAGEVKSFKLQFTNYGYTAQYYIDLVITNGCSVGSNTVSNYKVFGSRSKLIEIISEQQEESKSEIDKLNKQLEYYKSYSSNCYDLVKAKEKEIEKIYTEKRFKYTWSGCKYDNELRLNAVYQGDSMFPLLGENHKITWCIPYGDDDVYVGDIVLFTFTDDTAMNAHQIVKKEWIEGEWVYITQGFNNPLGDGMVLTFDNIRGKLWKVEG